MPRLAVTDRAVFGDRENAAAVIVHIWRMREQRNRTEIAFEDFVTRARLALLWSHHAYRQN
jgi:hypothetical protein